jgi:3-oxoacyl-[acyl-carrier-protein] synthase-3
MNDEIGISFISYYLPQKKKDLATLSRENKLDSDVKKLENLGFTHAFVAQNQNHIDLAEETIKKTLKESKLKSEDIDLFVFSGALPGSVLVKEPKVGQTLDIFKYSASKLQYDFGLNRAGVLAISQQGCGSLMNSIWVARNTLLAEKEMKNSLIVSSDVLPVWSKREMIYNVISDGSCAAILQKGSAFNKMVSYTQLTKGYYWDPLAKRNELIAAYFPTAKVAIEKALKKSRLRLSEIDWIIPHNVSIKSWEILLKLLKFPEEKLYSGNMIKKGHTIAADNFINLKDATDDGLIKHGQKLLLFTFGFGANWSCLILEH